MAEHDAKFWIAQYVREPFRREARNIGVIVLKGDRVAARFEAEKEGGKIDRRYVQWMGDSVVYQQWVEYWRELLAEVDESLPDRLASENGSNYNIVNGGILARSGDDSVEALCQYLFPLLVEGGAGSPTRSEDSEGPTKKFKDEIKGTFKQLGILSGSEIKGVHHPIVADSWLAGATVDHHPSFFQKNGTMWVMEPVNFALTSKTTIEKQAYYAAKMFDDLRKGPHKADPIALVQGTDEDLDGEESRRLSTMLKGSGRFVRWDRDSDRKELLSEREQTALSNGKPKDDAAHPVQ